MLLSHLLVVDAFLVAQGSFLVREMLDLSTFGNFCISWKLLNLYLHLQYL